MPNLVSLSLRGRIGEGEYSDESFHYVEVDKEKLQMMKNNLGLEPDDIVIIKRPNDPYLKVSVQDRQDFLRLTYVDFPS